MAEYIDRDAAISLIKQYGYDAIDGGRYSLDTVDDCIELANCIEALPAADVAPVVHGRWIVKKEWRLGRWVKWLECSNCGEHEDNFDMYEMMPFCEPYDYCPNCGAKMDEKEAVYD